MNGGIEYTSIMKKPNKLVVLGCSVSDYTMVDEPWGKILADTMNCEYIHEAAGCGSNWRMWRRAYDLIKNKKITSSDTVIVQYTEFTRREFWSPFQTVASSLYGSNNKSFLTETYQDGTIIRYKLDAHTFGDYTRHEQQFLKLYNYFVNKDFELEQFNMMHEMFQSFLKQEGFEKLYFLKAGGYGPLNSSMDLIEYYRINWIDAPNCFDNHLVNDKLHMNQQGHRELASLVHTFYKENS